MGLLSGSGPDLPGPYSGCVGDICPCLAWCPTAAVPCGFMYGVRWLPRSQRFRIVPSRSLHAVPAACLLQLASHSQPLLPHHAMLPPQASIEETYLTDKFGEEYKELVKSTKKFIPGEQTCSVQLSCAI